MSKEVAAEIIAVGGIALVQAATFAISRLNANDIRTNVARDIDIILKLDPNSNEAKKLADHVSARIKMLIHRDKRRDSD